MLKKTTLAFTPWLYGVNVPRGSRRTVCRLQSCQDLEDLARLIREQAVVGQHHGRPSAGLQGRQDVLDEVQLLVAGRDGEVVAVGGLVRALGAERRVGQDHIEPVGRRGFVDRVAQNDVRLDPVKEEVHQGQPARAGNQVLPVVGLLLTRLAVSRSNAPPLVSSISHS